MRLHESASLVDVGVGMAENRMRGHDIGHSSFWRLVFRDQSNRDVPVSQSADQFGTLRIANRHEADFGITHYLGRFPGIVVLPNKFDIVLHYFAAKHDCFSPGKMSSRQVLS